MLGLLRKKKTMKKIMWLLAATIIPVFAFWGVGSAIRSNQFDTAGSIYGKKISDRDYLHAYNAVRTKALMMYGDQFNQFSKFLNLKKQAWERLILLEETKKQHIKVNNQGIIAHIQEMPLFQREGKFNQEIYNRILAFGFQIKPRDFEEWVRDDIKISKLRDSAISDVEVSDEEIKQAFTKQNTDFKINYVKISAKDFVEEKEKEGNEPIKKEALEKAKALVSQRIQKLAEELKNLLNQESFDFNKSCFKLGYEAKESEYFKADSFNKDLGPTNNFSEVCATLETGELSSVVEVLNSFFIFSLVDKRPPSDQEYNEKIQAFRKNFIFRKEGLTFQEFLNRLTEDAYLKENQQFFERYNLQ